MFGEGHCFVSVSSSCFQSKITDLSGLGGPSGDQPGGVTPSRRHRNASSGATSSRGRFQRDHCLTSGGFTPDFNKQRFMAILPAARRQIPQHPFPALGNPHAVHCGFNFRSVIIIRSLFKVFIPTRARFAVFAKKRKIKESSRQVAPLGQNRAPSQAAARAEGAEPWRG